MLIHRLSAGFEKCKVISQKGFGKFKVFFIEGESKSGLENEPKSEFVGKQKSKFNNKNTSNKIPIINAKFLWLVLMNGLTYALLNVDDFVVYLFKAFVWNFGLFFCVFYLCSFLKQIFYKIILNVLFWASFAICIINLFLFINFNFLLDPMALQIFFATNTREAGEFIGFYTGTSTIIAISIFSALSLLAFFSKFSLKVPNRLCLLIILISIMPLTINVIKASYDKTADKTLLLHFTRVFNKGYAEQMKFVKEYQNLDEKLDLMLAKKLADKRERETRI